MIKYITKLDRATIGNAEDLDLFMPIYNLLEYRSNYSDTTGSLWFCSRDEATNFSGDIEDDNTFASIIRKH